MLTFQGVTPEVFALVLDQLRTEATVTEFQALRIWTEGDKTFNKTVPGWQIDGNGVKATVTRSNAGSIDVEITKKPFFVSEGMIGAKIRDAITLAQQAVAKAGQGGGTVA